MSLRLKSGKFYDDAGNVVPLEFGNKEQCDVLARVEVMRREGEFLEKDFIISRDETRITGVCYAWECFCGTLIRVKIHDDMNGRKYKCKVCGMRFQTGYDIDFEEIMVKLIS